jgi:phosphoribosylformylglycinamidine synthase
MILFFRGQSGNLMVVDCKKEPDTEAINKLKWLFSEAHFLSAQNIKGTFIGPRKEMITPWSTNAVEITQNMGIRGIERIEEFIRVTSANYEYDPMLKRLYHELGQDIFTIDIKAREILHIDDIEAYNRQEGLALSKDEIAYLEDLSCRLDRKLTDSEIFGFSQVNSEHCRHKIFNGKFIIDGEEKAHSLFELIKLTTRENVNHVISAYKDNCAFIQGPVIDQFAPKTQDKPDFFELKKIETVISLKAETHNFPTTVEPFNGAATGTGGEIRDRIAGGKGALPLAGTAVYMTSYSRLGENHTWETDNEERKWLYQTPSQILIKASNGASDFGNKFGQPLICGSVLTFEHSENGKHYGYDKVIMLAGGIGFGKKADSEKGRPSKGDKIVLLGGDNYRIGMGGGAVSSVATGEYTNAIELNAVQRSNPEMQKRLCNAIRALAESEINTIVSIHDHGAGGHLNCLSELVEETGGKIDLTKLPIGDPTLSDKEIIGNESQERMGLILKVDDIEQLKNIAARERAPMYVIGEVTGDRQFVFENKDGKNPLNLQLSDMFGNPPRTLMLDSRTYEQFSAIEYQESDLPEYIKQVLRLEAVACKDWLTNKVDRSVTGKVAKQQTAGPLQLPLNNVGVVALDFTSNKGIATSIGHAPVAALIDPKAGSMLSITESLTNLVFAPLANGLKSVSLSANWMWPCKNPGEDARLFDAVEAASDFAVALGINIPTGKDSLSMTQKYPDGKTVLAPGTVIITASAEVSNIRGVVEPVIQAVENTELLYIPFADPDFDLGGSSFSQVIEKPGRKTPQISEPALLIKTFNTIQKLIGEGLVLAGHDVSSGGLVTTLLEMCFADNHVGLDLDLSSLGSQDLISKLFSEQPAIVIQVQKHDKVDFRLKANNILYKHIGNILNKRYLSITNNDKSITLDINSLRDIWFSTSSLLDSRQTSISYATLRKQNYKQFELDFQLPDYFTGILSEYRFPVSRIVPKIPKTAIIREKGVNGDREMAYALFQAGMDVKDVHMTDLITGRETLEDIQMIVFVGGFSNSDVLGSAKGWAGAFLFNQKARESLDKFYARPDTLSLGVCNGCQVMMELGLIVRDHEKKPFMSFNDSHKFESSFLSVDIPVNRSIMLGNLAGSRMGIWVGHGEGKFNLPMPEDHYAVAMKYTYTEYPGNPNGSDYAVAALCSDDGRHLVMMPHLERSLFPWNWAYYPSSKKHHEISPWIEAFVNARKWIENAKK